MSATCLTPPIVIPDWLANLLVPDCSPITVCPCFNWSTVHALLLVSEGFGPITGPLKPFIWHCDGEVGDDSGG